MYGSDAYSSKATSKPLPCLPNRQLLGCVPIIGTGMKDSCNRQSRAGHNFAQSRHCDEDHSGFAFYDAQRQAPATSILPTN